MNDQSNLGVESLRSLVFPSAQGNIRKGRCPFSFIAEVMEKCSHVCVSKACRHDVGGLGLILNSEDGAARQFPHQSSHFWQFPTKHTIRQRFHLLTTTLEPKVHVSTVCCTGKPTSISAFFVFFSGPPRCLT